jgi:hypothetical protein
MGSTFVIKLENGALLNNLDYLFIFNYQRIDSMDIQSENRIHQNAIATDDSTLSLQ